MISNIESFSSAPENEHNAIIAYCAYSNGREIYVIRNTPTRFPINKDRPEYSIGQWKVKDRKFIKNQNKAI